MLLQAELIKVQKLTAQAKVVNPKVSHASVHWHLAHLLLVIIRIIQQLQKSDPDQYRWQPNLARSYIFMLGFIPRGRGKSPQVVNPNATSEIDLPQLVTQAQETLSILPQLADQAFFKHPYFGTLKKSHATKFLELHTRHHLKIIDDILT